MCEECVLFAQQGKSMRLLAGNTGYGIYKDWPDEDVIINVKSIPDLHKLHLSKVAPYFVAGGGGTHTIILF